MSSKNLTLKRVLVSGGGLAGPAIATLLARDGVDVTVIEIADGVRPAGQAVHIRGAGRTVLNRMGLLDQARVMRLHQQGIADVDSRGRRRTEMTVEDFGGEGMISEIEILRGDLAPAAAPAPACQKRLRSSPVRTRNAWPWENPADGPRTALRKIRSRLSAGTGSPVHWRTMCRRRTTSLNSMPARVVSV